MFLCMQYFQSRDLKYLPPITFLLYQILGFVEKEYRKRAKVQLYPSLPFLYPLIQCFSSVVRESCAGTSSEITVRVQSSHRLYRKTRPYQKLPHAMWLWRAHLREWNQQGIFGATEWMNMLASSYPPYFLHHARETSETCYQESLLAEKQHGSFKYLSYVLFFNRYMQVVSLVFGDGRTSVKCR